MDGPKLRLQERYGGTPMGTTKSMGLNNFNIKDMKQRIQNSLNKQRKSSGWNTLESSGFKSPRSPT
jgi:hypothetical protein